MHGSGMRDFGSAGAKFDRASGEREREDFSNFEQLSTTAPQNVGFGEGVVFTIMGVGHVVEWTSRIMAEIKKHESGAKKSFPKPRYTPLSVQLSWASAVLPSVSRHRLSGHFFTRTFS